MENQYHCLELLSEKNNLSLFKNQFFKEFLVHCDIKSKTDV